jgi:hypothetical protein
MTPNAQPHALKSETVDAVICALWSGIPQLSLLNDSDHPLVLRKVRRGEIIDDPEAEHPVEALRNGIYQRCLVTRDATPSDYRWMFLCSTDDLHETLAAATGRVNPVEREAIGLDAAWQAMQWTETRKRKSVRAAA